MNFLESENYPRARHSIRPNQIRWKTIHKELLITRMFLIHHTQPSDEDTRHWKPKGGKLICSVKKKSEFFLFGIFLSLHRGVSVCVVYLCFTMKKSPGLNLFIIFVLFGFSGFVWWHLWGAQNSFGICAKRRVGSGYWIWVFGYLDFFPPIISLKILFRRWKLSRKPNREARSLYLPQELRNTLQMLNK